MKKVIGVLAIAFALFSCNKHDERNEEMVNFFSSQPHNKDLYGWWVEKESLNSNSVDYYLFDSIQHKQYDAFKRADGSVHKYKTSITHWYTNDSLIYFYQEGDWKIGPAEYETKYKLSADKQKLIYLHDYLEGVADTLLRVSEP